MIRVLVADDHAVVRQGIRQIFSKTSDIVVADEATSAKEALEKVAKGGFDLLLLDISMPGRGGLEVLQQLRAEGSRLPVLMLSIHTEEQYAVRALKAGAGGYLTKSSAPDELIIATRKVAGGKKFLSAYIADKLVALLDEDAQQLPHELLSNREFEVFRRLASGASLTEVALGLALSLSTVSTYRARVLEKMHLRTNTDLVRYALEHKLIE